MPKKAQPGEISKKCFCIDYHILNSSTPPDVKAHSKAQGVLSLVSLQKIDELYPMLNDSTVYYSLDCTSGILYCFFSLEAQKKCIFVTPSEKFELKKVLFGLAQASTQ